MAPYRFLGFPESRNPWKWMSGVPDRSEEQKRQTQALEVGSPKVPLIAAFTSTSIHPVTCPNDSLGFSQDEKTWVPSQPRRPQDPSVCPVLAPIPYPSHIQRAGSVCNDVPHHALAPLRRSRALCPFMPVLRGGKIFLSWFANGSDPRWAQQVVDSSPGTGTPKERGGVAT